MKPSIWCHLAIIWCDVAINLAISLEDYGKLARCFHLRPAMVRTVGPHLILNVRTCFPCQPCVRYRYIPDPATFRNIPTEPRTFAPRRRRRYAALVSKGLFPVLTRPVQTHTKQNKADTKHTVKKKNSQTVYC
jgi:hypothetical protein